jgi:hypothetical protein
MILVLLVMFVVAFIFGVVTGGLLATAKYADTLARVEYHAFKPGKRIGLQHVTEGPRLVAGGRQAA